MVYLNMLNLKFFFSPVFALFTSIVIAFAALIQSAGFYRANLHEKSEIYLNSTVGLWILVCSISYLLGIIAYEAIWSSRKNRYISSQNLAIQAVNSKKFTKLLLIFTLLINLFAIYQLVAYFGFYGFYMTLLGNGSEDLRLAVYRALKAVNTGWAIAFTVPVVCVSYVTVKKTKDRNVGFLLFFLLIIHIILILSTQSKGPIATIAISIMICELLINYPKVKINFKKFVIGLFLAIVLAFSLLIIQSRRNPEILTYQGVYNELVSYTLVSYNRLAYVMNGQLEIPNDGIGFWTNRWYWGLPGDTIVPNLFDIKPQYDAFSAWLETFNRVDNAKLDERYIWITIYGEVYVDYGYFGFMWFIIYGLFSQMLYRHISRGNLPVYAIYPFVMQCNFGWYSGAAIGTRATLLCVIIAVYIAVSNKISQRKEMISNEGENYHTVLRKE